MSKRLRIGDIISTQLTAVSDTAEYFFRKKTNFQFVNLPGEDILKQQSKVRKFHFRNRLK